MKSIFGQILVVLLLSTALFAQIAEQKYKAVTEMGNATLEETAAYLDGLTIQLEKNPNTKSLIRISGGHERFYAFPYIYGAIYKAYLKNNRRLPAEKFTIQFCNINKEPIRTQFFILDETEKIEPCEENLTAPEKTVLFEHLYFYYDDTEFSSKKPLEATFIDTVGPSEQEYSQTTQNALLRLLNQSPESKIYLVGYLGTNLYGEGNKEIRKLDKRKVLDKIFRSIEKEFVQSGINASRIVRIYGGYRDDVKNVEIWLAPKGGEIPKPKPDYFPKKKK